MSKRYELWRITPVSSQPPFYDIWDTTLRVSLVQGFKDVHVIPPFTKICDQKYNTILGEYSDRGQSTELMSFVGYISKPASEALRELIPEEFV